MSSTVFATSHVGFSYPGATTHALSDISFSVPAGALCTLIGPNGSGKSTLLRVLVGVLHAQTGSTLFDGRDVASYQRRDLAKRIGVVPQAEELAFPFTVRELVAMGRYPHLGALQAERAEDREAIQRALETCDVAQFENRPLTTLSGGERQRARVARALAQEPDTLLLDEPTNSLDIRHEMQIFEILRGLCQKGVTIVLVTHNLNLAARYASQLLLLDRGEAAAQGTPDEVLTSEIVERVYRWPVLVHPYPAHETGRGAPQITPRSSAEAS